jgi:hypothetical protein
VGGAGAAPNPYNPNSSQSGTRPAESFILLVVPNGIGRENVDTR